jgi:hypothetical protein
VTSSILSILNLQSFSNYSKLLIHNWREAASASFGPCAVNSLCGDTFMCLAAPELTQTQKYPDSDICHRQDNYTLILRHTEEGRPPAWNQCHHLALPLVRVSPQTAVTLLRERAQLSQFDSHLHDLTFHFHSHFHEPQLLTSLLPFYLALEVEGSEQSPFVFLIRSNM